MYLSAGGQNRDADSVRRAFKSQLVNVKQILVGFIFESKQTSNDCFETISEALEQGSELAAKAAGPTLRSHEAMHWGT